MCRYTKLTLMLFFFLVLIGTRFAAWENAWLLNFGLIMIQKGLVANQVEYVAYGQQMLSRAALANEYFAGFAQAQIDPDNLLLNGGFEFAGYGWLLGRSSQVTDEAFRQGHRSLEVTFNNTEETFYHVYQEVYVQPDSCYRLSAYVQIEGVVDGIGIELWDAERGFRHWYGGKSELLEGPTDWIPLFVEFCTESDIERVQVRLRRYPQNNSSAVGAVWFDDFFLEPVATLEVNP